MSKRILLGGMVILLIGAGPALGAGKNDGGAMLIHTTNAEAYTSSMQPCGTTWDQYAPATCEDVVTQADLGSDSVRQLVWYVAAFHPDADPGVTVVFFGHNHNFPPGEGWLDTWNFCGPDGTLEVADAGWPEDVNAGNSVAFGAPVVDDHFFPFYWFAAYAFDGIFMEIGPNPTGGYASFVSDDNPGFEDVITRFGTLRFYEPGETVCPVAPTVGACCLPDGTCAILLEPECEQQPTLGQYQGDDTTCDAISCGACCYWRRQEDSFFRSCVVTGMTDCEEGSWAQWKRWIPVQGDSVGSNWSTAGTECGTEEERETKWYCEDPLEIPNPTEETSWGRLKSLFR
ncbi:MAG: hypothetical protein GF346_04925 [Candidatus Eisenbacteria bacterium]|nr:hypothetical protein [Candidatus Latescibacterota bacterium]MBD3301769.1 hypothetical protein [Candidatus Eisenbacteria bacterium]